MDETSGASLGLGIGVPCYQIDDEEGRTHLLIQLTLKEEDADRWCFWRPEVHQLATGKKMENNQTIIEPEDPADLWKKEEPE
jgi:hypothetical protein